MVDDLTYYMTAVSRLRRELKTANAALSTSVAALERIASNAGFGTPGMLGYGWADNEARQRMRVAREALDNIRAALDRSPKDGR